MHLSRLAYRSRQFLSASFQSHKPVESDALYPYLSPVQIALFRQMQLSEQVHAFQVYERLKVGGQPDCDLLAAALLHDVGKTLFPLSLWERVRIVLGRYLFPKAARRWGEGQPRGLQRPFVVAAHHAGWGADLAARAGASARTVELIRRHHDPSPADDPLLAALRQADDFE